MANQQVTPEESVAPAEARLALDRLLASEMFQGSPQLATFLRFVVEATLRGESSRIKGYTIGVEALGRPENFDPQIDPIVRVEATRLRRTLDRYYAGPGAADPIVFALSRGSYVPAIHRRAVEADEVVPEAPRLGPWGRFTATPGLWPALIVLAAVLVLAAGGVGLNRYLAKPGDQAAVPNDAQAFAGPLRSGNGLPSLMIPRIPFLNVAPAVGASRQPLAGVRPLRDKLRAAIARFDTMNVVGDPGEEAGPAGAAKPEPAADYQLIGSGEFIEDGSATVRFRLLDVAANAVVWSRQFGPFSPAVDYGPIEDGIVKQIAMTLAPPFGVIRSNERKKQLTTGEGDPRSRCLIEASESFRSFDPAQHGRARACLEFLTVRDPSFALGFAYLASVYSREYQYGLGGTSDDGSLLERALRAARQGVELSPESARAYQMLFTTLFARREIAAAFAAGDRARALNPYDMTILSDYGGRLILIGEVDRGMETLAQSADAGTVRPSWYHFYLFLGGYLKNDKATASMHAAQITSDVYPLGLLARTLAAASEGNRELAQRNFDRLVALRPAWRASARGELGRHFPVASTADRLARDLAAAGLVTAE